MEPDQRTLELMRRADALVLGHHQERKLQGIAHMVEMLTIADRCHSLHSGVYRLLEHGLLHEAIILNRPLFTDSLALAELAAASETERGSMMVGRHLADLAPLEGLAHERARLGTDPTPALAKLADRRRAVEAYAAQHGYGTRHWKPDDQNLRDMAERHGRAPEYVALLVMHQFVHGATEATGDRIAVDDDGSVTVGGSASRGKPLEREIGMHASHSLLHATRSTSVIFGWPEPPELQPLMNEIIAEVKRERVRDGADASEA